MLEKWAVAYDTFGTGQGKFEWVRDQSGDIMIFNSKWEARKWVLTRSSIGHGRDEVVFVKVIQRDQAEDLH